MPQDITFNKQIITAKALFIGTRIDIKPFCKLDMFMVSPLFFSYGKNGFITLFKYGSMVLFNLSPEEEITFLDEIKPYVSHAFETPTIEQEHIIKNENECDGHGANGIIVKDWNLERLLTIAEILSRSAVLSYYEIIISNNFEKIDPITENLSRGRMCRGLGRKILKQMGNTLAIERQMIGQVEINEKPEILWESPEIEPLYIRLAGEFELSERTSALRYKLNLLYRAAETMSGLLQDKRTLHVEWYIVFLILFEIIMSLSEKIFGL